MAKTLLVTTYRTAANATLREEELDGRTYLVAPVIAIRQQVMNRILNLESEITAVLPRWGGIPLVMGHPKENGDFISANSPEVLRRQGIGYMFHPVWRNGALHAEAWLDVAKCEALGGAALRALNAVREGKVIEVSTGYLGILEEASGEYDGIAYDAIARNLVPDHLAILPDEIGACSVRDGCGLPRVNVANECGCASKGETVVVNERTGAMVALFVPADVASALALSESDLPAGSSAVPSEEMHVTLAYLGDVDDLKISHNELLTAVASFAQEAPIVMGLVGGMGRFSTDEGDTNALYASADSPQLPEFRQRLIWQLPTPVKQNHGFIPHITLAYIPAEAETPQVMPERLPLTFPFISVAWAGQVTHFPLQGMAEVPAIAANEENPMQKEQETIVNEDIVEEVVEETVEATAVTDVPEAAQPEAPAPVVNEETEGGAEAEVTAPAGPTAPDIAALVQAAVTEAMAPYQQALASLQVNADRQRCQLVNELLAAPNMAFTREELRAMTDLQLNRLAQTLSAPNYTGQANSRVPAVVEEWVAWE